MAMAMNPGTHEVFNQSTTFSDVNLLAGNPALADALRFNHPQLDLTALHAVGAETGSVAMQRHARLANAFPPQLRSHDRFGQRIDQVEFHPSYHHLLRAALQHRLHATPWTAGAGAHIERAAAFMLFTECEPSVLCPVSMSYAVMPALRANAAIHSAWAPGLASPRYDGRFLPHDRKTGLMMGMGMTEKQGGSDVRANTTRADHDGDDAWGRRYRISGHKWFLSAPMCDALPHPRAGRRRAVVLLPAAPAARRHGQRDRHPAPEAQARQPRQRQLGSRVRCRRGLAGRRRGQGCGADPRHGRDHPPRLRPR